MKKQIDAYITKLYEAYENHPVIKGLIQALFSFGLPIGLVVDASINTYVNKIKADRLHTFFEELNSGDIELSEDIINNTDFLHAYIASW